MDIEAQMFLRDILVVLFWDDQCPDTCLFRTISLLKDTTDRTDPALQRDLTSHSHILPDFPASNGTGNHGQDSRTSRWPIDIAAADDIDVDIIVMDILACKPAHDRRRIEYRVLGHRARCLIEADHAFALFMRLERHRLDLNDRAEESGHTQSKDMTLDGLVRSLFRHELVQTTDLGYFIDVTFRDTDRRPITRAELLSGNRIGSTAAVQHQAVGISQDIDGLTAFDRIFTDEFCYPVIHRNLEFFRCILHDLLNMPRRQWLKIDLGTARTQGRIDM